MSACVLTTTQTPVVPPLSSSSTIDELFKHYRQTGFPFVSRYTSEQVKHSYQQLTKKDASSLLVDNTVKMSTAGLSFLWSYFPHRWSVRCGRMRTVLETFNDDKQLRRCLEKCIKYHGKVTDGHLRDFIKIYSGTQAPSNFRPTAAAAIYKEFLPVPGTVWDMSSGFGGRLLGAAISGHVKQYIGTDPCSATYDGLTALASDIQQYTSTQFDLHKCGSEDFLPARQSLDLCFTSPPYFDCERYSDEDTQSYKRYPTRNEWLTGYMSQTLDNCIHGLKYNAPLVLNIANVNSYKSLVPDVIELAKSKALTLERELKLQLSRPMGVNRGMNVWKYKPILVFRLRNI